MGAGTFGVTCSQHVDEGLCIPATVEDFERSQVLRVEVEDLISPPR